MKTSHTPHETETLAWADLLLLIADLLSPPWTVDPGAFRVHELDQARLLDAAEMTDDPRLRAALRQALAEAGRADGPTRSMLFTSLFEGAIACPANESAYIRRDKGAILADICGFYRAFGFTTTAAAGEKADHLVCQLQFLSMLLVMLADARRRRDESAAQTTRDAFTAFTVEHTAEWISAFCQRLNDVSDAPFYKAVAALLERTWQALARRHDLPVGQSTAVADPAACTDLDDTPYECGMSNPASPTTLSIGGVPLHDPVHSS